MVLGKPYKQSMSLPFRNSYQSIYTRSDAASGICLKPIQPAKKQTNKTPGRAGVGERRSWQRCECGESRVLDGRGFVILFMLEHFSTRRTRSVYVSGWSHPGGVEELLERLCALLETSPAARAKKGIRCAPIRGPFLLWVGRRWMPSVWCIRKIRSVLIHGRGSGGKWWEADSLPSIITINLIVKPFSDTPPPPPFLSNASSLPPTTLECSDILDAYLFTYV